MIPNARANTVHAFSRRELLQSSAVVASSLICSTGSRSAAGRPLPQESNRAGSNRGRIYKAVKGGGVGTRQAMITRLTQLKQLGFDGIEGVSPGVSDKRGFVDALQETGMQAHGVVDMVHWKQRLSSPEPSEREAGRQALLQAIEDAKSYGGSSVLLVPGKVTGASETHEDVWHRSQQEVRQVLPRASRLGIHILVETVWNGFCEQPDQFRKYLDEFNSPWVGAYFDIGNMQKFAPAEEWIRILGPRIVKLDVKDWGRANGFCRLGDGDVNWDRVREALAEIGFTGWATREGRDGGDDVTARLMNELLDL